MSSKRQAFRMADNLGDLVNILEEWKDTELDTLSKVLEDAGKAAVQELKSNSPTKTGSYRKGWRVKKTEKKKGVIEVTVYNKTDYQITHLLEHGHALVLGGRTLGRVKAYPHIEPAEEHAINKAETELKIKL